MTEGKFIPNPFDDRNHSRLYRTGDLARYLPDGSIEYLGRLDHQVKVHGYRIELEEIEGVLRQHPGVREGLVVTGTSESGDKRLVAYTVPRTERGTTADELRRFLKTKLPEYMIPDGFVMLDELPLTPNGKVDRRALPMPDTLQSGVETAFVTPRTPTEELLANIWAEVLGLERVSIHDNFFDLGGHSLQATQIVSRLRSTFAVELPVRCIFECPTLALLAEKLAQTKLEHEEPQEITQLLQALEQMSEEDARKMLEDNRARP